LRPARGDEGTCTQDVSKREVIPGTRKERGRGSCDGTKTELSAGMSDAHPRLRELPMDGKGDIDENWEHILGLKGKAINAGDLGAPSEDLFALFALRGGPPTVLRAL